MIARLKWWALEALGFVFCEITFQWFSRLGDVPWDETTWKWYHHVYYNVGVAPYKVGTFFYGLQKDGGVA